MIERMNEAAMPAPIFIKSAAGSATRVPGTAVFMTTSSDGIPHALLHNLKHNKVLHERIILLTVRIEDVPYVEDSGRTMIDNLGNGFYRLVIRYGFMQEVDVPAALAELKECGPMFKMMDTSFFLARQTLLASSRPVCDMARKAVRLDAGNAEARWNSSSCRPIAFWASWQSGGDLGDSGGRADHRNRIVRRPGFRLARGMRRAHYPADRNRSRFI